MSTARDLTSELLRLLRAEQGAMADFLLALADFDRKKLWRELEYASLFSFLVRELKLSKGAAQNRKTAVELIQAFPDVEAALRSGALCLSTVTVVARVLTPENHDEVLPRFFGLSYSEADAVAASLRPAEVIPVRDFVTAVPTTERASRPTLALAMEPGPSPTLAGHPGQPTIQAVHTYEPTSGSVHPDEASPLLTLVPAPPPAPPRESLDRLDGERSRLHVTVTAGFLEKLEAAKDALGHACPDGSAAEVLERGLDLVLAQHAKRRGLVATPRKPRPVSQSDTIPAHVKREVWLRAGGRCEWRLESGERCDCTRRLEYDHVQPVALGGVAITAGDVRLLCRPHNQLAARRVFGDAVMDRYARRRG